MKKQIALAVSLSLGVFLLALINKYLNFGKIISSFESFSPVLLVPYFLVSFAIMFLLVLRWKLILKSQGHNISITRLFSYKLSSFAVTYLTPTKKIGGEPLRAYLLKRSNVPLHKGASSVILDEVLEFLGDMFFSLVGFIILFTQFSISLKAQLLIIIFLVFWLLVLIRFIYNSLHGKGTISPWMEILRIDRIKFVKKFKEKIKNVESWNIKFFQQKNDFYIALMISVSLWLLMFVEYKLALNMLGYNPGLKEIFLILAFVSIAYMLPVPAAIGVLEALQVSIFSLLGINLGLAVALSFLVRAKDLIWTLIGIINLYGHGTASVIKNLFKK